MRGAGYGMPFPVLVLAACGFLAGLVGTRPVRGAGNDDGANDRRPRYFTLDQLDAYLEFESEFTQTRVRQAKRPREFFRRSQTNRDWTLEERVGFQLAGTVLDPSVLTFAGDFSFALTQAHSVERSPFFDETDDDSGYLLQYDMRLNFFPGRKLSGSVYALRQDDRINRRFQPSLDEERTGFGASWTFAHDRFPMELTYDYLETDRTGNRDPRDDEHFTESTLRYQADWIVSEHHRFTLSLEHAETKQEYQGSPGIQTFEPEGFETTRDLFTIEHQLAFGDRHQHDLRTLVHWQEESGDFARDLFEIGPQLTLRHSDSLETSYKYQFNRERYAGLDIETQRADFQLVHRVYDNLVTTVDLFGLYEDVEDDVQTTQYGGSINWQYNRGNRWGRLYADLAVAYDTEDINGDNGPRVVLNEAGTFRDPLAITLRNRNVIPASVVVTDTSNRRFYIPGRDYLVTRLGDVTQVARIPSGRITDGDTVLIDYEYRTPADGKVDTVRVDFNLEQRFNNGLRPYYRFSYRNQETESSFGFARYGIPGFADRTNHHRIGLRYEKDAYTLGAEFEVFDDSVEPYDAFHLDGLWHIVRKGRHTLDGSARLSRFLFEGGLLEAGRDDRDVTILDLELDHRWRLRENLSTFERVAFRWEDDSTAGLTHAWDVTAGVDYVVGDLTVELAFEYDRLNLPGSDEDDFGVFLRVRRDFPNVLARW